VYGTSQEAQTELYIDILTFEVLTAVKMWIVVLRIVMPCGLVGVYERFGGTYYPEDGGGMFL
jgi:hypothetical protein